MANQLEDNLVHITHALHQAEKTLQSIPLEKLDASGRIHVTHLWLMIAEHRTDVATMEAGLEEIVKAATDQLRESLKQEEYSATS